jgi:hypothetical protein
LCTRGGRGRKERRGRQGQLGTNYVQPTEQKKENGHVMLEGAGNVRVRVSG